MTMNGLIALLGSGEYLPVMDEVDSYLLANCGADAKARKPRVVCLPTAAGQEGPKSVSRWSNMGVEHFTRLGAEVQALPIIDAQSANDPKYALAVGNADIIYFSGGNPSYLYATMKDSLVWQAGQKAWARGAVYAGCSAGAMILGTEMPDFRAAGIRSTVAFGILPIASLMPHFNAMPLFGKPLVATLRRRLREGEIMLGVDEDTAIVGRRGEEWTVMGKSKAHVFTRDESRSYSAGEKFMMK
jgi:cyanophycinase-like exopeptidase